MSLQSTDQMLLLSQITVIPIVPPPPPLHLPPPPLPPTHTCTLQFPNYPQISENDGFTAGFCGAAGGGSKMQSWTWLKGGKKHSPCTIGCIWMAVAQQLLMCPFLHAPKHMCARVCELVCSHQTFPVCWTSKATCGAGCGPDVAWSVHSGQDCMEKNNYECGRPKWGVAGSTGQVKGAFQGVDVQSKGCWEGRGR